jgi:hypothetical protein
MSQLVQLIYEDLVPARDYLRDVALVLGSLQRGFLQPHPHDWQHGLEVTMRGISTQAFMVNGEEVRASIDLVRNKVRLPGMKSLSLEACKGPELFQAVQQWVHERAPEVQLEKPEFSGGKFDSFQTGKYAHTLWWMHQQFRLIREQLTTGLASPILLYPHHFDLSLSWFPKDNEQQLSLGWSTGDDTIPEPYVYGTAYPEPPDFKQIKLPYPAYLQSKGFTGAILLDKDLAADQEPEKLLAEFAHLFLAGSLLTP